VLRFFSDACRVDETFTFSSFLRLSTVLWRFVRSCTELFTLLDFARHVVVFPVWSSCVDPTGLLLSCALLMFLVLCSCGVLGREMMVESLRWAVEAEAIGFEAIGFEALRAKMAPGFGAPLVWGRSAATWALAAWA
jgi:hypothetical protein